MLRKLIEIVCKWETERYRLESWEMQFKTLYGIFLASLNLAPAGLPIFNILYK